MVGGDVGVVGGPRHTKTGTMLLHTALLCMHTKDEQLGIHHTAVLS